MRSHTFKEWVATTRYWSFSVSAFPVLAATAYLTSVTGFQQINWVGVLLALIGVVVLHAAGNLLSDVGDYRSGADCAEAFAVPNLVQQIFNPADYLRLSAVLFFIGISIGLILTWLCGFQLLFIGGIGVILTLLYTKSKNVFLSDITIFIVFGVLILLGTSVVALGEIRPDVLLLSLPIGLITTSVLHANNTVDIVTDEAAGVHTLAMAMGEANAVKCYVAYQVLPFVFMFVCVAMGLLPWLCLLCLLAIVPAAQNIKKALSYRIDGRKALIGLDLASAKLQLLFSLALTVSLFVSALW